jgi:peptide deformylase
MDTLTPRYPSKAHTADIEGMDAKSDNKEACCSIPGVSISVARAISVPRELSMEIKLFDSAQVAGK